MMNGRVIIYSKFPLVRKWLSYSLKELGWEVVLSEDPQDKIKCDVAIVEINEESDTIFLENIHSPVVAFSRLPESKLVGLLFDFEVKGVIRLSSALNSVKETIIAAAKGDEYFDEVFISYLLSNKYREIHDRISSLSRREHEIIEGIFADMTNDEIADKFNLSVRTVNAHKRNILQKMQERSLVGVIKTMLTYTLRYF
ncbi:MAG: response regulator transcription factor [Cytophagales bacterium]|nr:response regulator transcription factor [Cytophagales bacterium]